MKHFVKVGVMIAVLAMLTACISIPLGDGEKMKLSKDGLTFTDGEGNDTNIEVDKDSEKISVTGGKDGEEVDFSIGSDLELPASFPPDIPMMEDAVIYQSLSTHEDKAITVSYTTNIPFEKVREMYFDYVKANYSEPASSSEELKESMKENGSDVENTESLADFMDNITGERDNERISVGVIKDSDEDQAEVIVTIIYYLQVE